MSPKACREYVQEMRSRYAAATIVERTGLLNEVVALTGYHRKYAISLLGRKARPPRKRRRRAIYGPEVVSALVVIWQAADYPWSVRLKASLPLWLPWLRARSGLDSRIEAALLRISVRTIDRLLRPKRGEIRRRFFGHTRRGILLKHQVPIRAERWDVGEAGWGELDTVAHCGGSAAGEFINSVNFTDIASAWTETRAICGKGEHATVGAIEQIRKSLPFTMRAIDSDSGAEFINHHCVRYCREKEIIFTRGRPYKKNDNAHIEQKNWTHVRKIFGWQRFEGAEVAEAMNELYCNELRIWLNYFQPSVKLQTKRRVGSRVRKYYDAAATPLDRLVELGALTPEHRDYMLAERSQIDPFSLAEAIEGKLKSILAAAAQDPVHPSKRGQAPGLNFRRLAPRDEYAAYISGKNFSGATSGT